MACPICNRATDATYRPFCSKRCADLDLAKWLTGAYAIPGEVAEDDDPDLRDTGPGDSPDSDTDPPVTRQ